MKPGDVLYTGHIATAAEAQAYNQHQMDCDKYLAEKPETAMKSGSIANRVYNGMLDRKHKLFQAIALNVK